LLTDSFASAVDHRVALFGQVYGDQNMVVGHEVLLLRVAIL
jgi:hypothetical protein